MEKSTPLFSAQHDSIDQVTVSLHQNLIPPSVPQLDEVIEQNLARFGLAQFIQAVLVSLLLIFEAQQIFISIYTDAEPTWHCINTTITTCSSSSDICSLSKREWGWDGRSDKTIVSEWSLECASSVLTGLPSSCFLIGSFLGGLALATLGDSSLGRKKLLFLSSFGMSISAFLTIFSKNIWVYSTLRFVSGVFRSSIMTSILVMLMEMVGKRWRGQVGIIAFSFFALGLISLPPIAYLNRDSSWKILYVWTSIPGIFCSIVIYPFVTESPRWLFMHGYEAEAVAVLKKLTSSENHDRLNFCVSKIPPKEIVSKIDLYSFLKDLFNRKWALRRLSTTMGLAFGLGLVYYGLLLGVGNLDFNIYLSSTFNALLEIPAYIITSILIERWNRRCSILTFSIVTGISSAICAVIGEGQEVLQVVMELVSFFSVCVAFNVLLIFATELFPTCVRNSTTSMVRQAVSFGAVFSPLLISAGST
ncbi:Organic cation/carnitine transporter [Melia azedarach]|uniref:Organic cation/carnitine transporter n=1 Tax=Melia azedarach TaxID=155640 RepID=A0ACC1X6D7_MELAZ|nr:Organic cation/carnitine transporter [Melia azedarach]